MTQHWNRLPRVLVKSSSLQIFKNCLHMVGDNLLQVTVLEQEDMTRWPPKVLTFFDFVFHYNTLLIIVMLIIMAVIMAMKIKCLTALFIYEVFKTGKRWVLLNQNWERILQSTPQSFVSSPLPLFNCHGFHLCGYAEKYQAVSEQHVNFLLSQVILGSSFVITLEEFVRYFPFGSLLALLLKYCEQFVNT